MCLAVLVGSKTRHACFKPQKNVKRKWFKKNGSIFEWQHGVLRGHEFTSPFSHTFCWFEAGHFPSKRPFPQLKHEGLGEIPAFGPLRLRSPAVRPEIRIPSPGSGCYHRTPSFPMAHLQSFQPLGFFCSFLLPFLTGEALSSRSILWFAHGVAGKAEETEKRAFEHTGCSLLANSVRLAHCLCSPRRNQAGRNIILNQPCLIK